MARALPNSFTKYQLTEEEQLSGQVLTTSNYHVVQNLIADAAESRLALTYDPSNPLTFVQREAELQGQIGVLKLLLELSVQAQSSIRHKPQE